MTKNLSRYFSTKHVCRKICFKNFLKEPNSEVCKCVISKKYLEGKSLEANEAAKMTAEED